MLLIIDEWHNKFKNGNIKNYLTRMSYQELKQIKDVKELGFYENSSWYKIYQQYRNLPKIYAANRDYLICRDITVVSLVMIFVLVIFNAFSAIASFSILLGLFILEYFLGCFATHACAKRFVYSVIAEDISPSCPANNTRDSSNGENK